MRCWLAALVFLAACGSRASTPAWPKMAERESDGGESIAPRQASATSIEAADDDDGDTTEKPATVAADTTEKPAAAAADAKATPAATTSTPVIAPEEVINIDEIVIEIEE